MFKCAGIVVIINFKIDFVLKLQVYPANILHKSTAGRYRPVSYPDGPITARYRFM